MRNNNNNNNTRAKCERVCPRNNDNSEKIKPLPMTHQLRARGWAGVRQYSLSDDVPPLPPTATEQPRTGALTLVVVREGGH